MLKNARLFVNLVFLLSAILTSSLPAEEEEPPPPLGIEIVSEKATIAPDEPFWIALRISLWDHWHTYWKNPGATGFPFEIQWQLPKDFKVDLIEWPAPKLHPSETGAVYVYEKEAIILVKIIPASTLNSPIKVSTEIKWLACSEDNCLPGVSEVELTIPASQHSQMNVNTHPLFSRARSQIPQPLSLKSARRSDGFISLELPFALDPKTLETTFFPENDLIDMETPPLLIKGQDDRLNLLLEESLDEEERSLLSGVLVFADNETHVESAIYAIDTPIEGTRDDAISMTDPTTRFFTHPESGFIWIALMAFVGGLILNLMPCVLPVISLKILSFVKFSGQKRSTTLWHGLAFSCGVLFSFWILAALLLSLQAYGQSVGWGFQLQEPLFVATLAAVILIFGLSMLGLFEIGTLFAAKAGKAGAGVKQESNWSAFFGGVLATAVATPCTGPFLGTAVGVAVTMPAIQAMAVFTSLGLGMASPYLVFSAFPQLLRFLPKPGQWMVIFKEITGFVMLATVLWLAWVFGSQTDIPSLILLLTAFFIFAIGCWNLGKWNTPIKKQLTRRLSCLLATACFATGSYLIIHASASSSEQSAIASLPNQLGWEKYSPERVAELQAAGTPVFVDFTAKWCLICQANHMVLSTTELEKKFADLGVVRMKADWTKGDTMITEQLRLFGRSGVPLYVLYGPQGSKPPIFLPQLLTQENVLDHLKQLEVERSTASSE